MENLDPLALLLTEKEKLARMKHQELLTLRQHNTAPGVQEILAPYEHRAFAREEVEENPLKALPLLFMIPGYQGAKALGLGGARTGPSFEQFKQGNIGILDGLKAYLGK